MDMKELIAEKQSYIEMISAGRKNIARINHDKILIRAELWDEATGTVDQKKDFIKSKVAEFDYDIATEEANIEYFYNMLGIIEDKMVMLEDE